MTPEWAATILANWITLAFIIVVRPPMRLLVAATVWAVACDWFFYANRLALQDELYNLPWHAAMVILMMLEIAAAGQCLKRNTDESFLAGILMLVHASFLILEFIVWEDFRGKFRFRDIAYQINANGWRIYHIRQGLRILMLFPLVALMMSERNQREEQFDES